MVVHKDDSSRMCHVGRWTECGRQVDVAQASHSWLRVTCKACLKKRKAKPEGEERRPNVGYYNY